ncbi:hypothetical protein GCM10022240_10300 [Microbacterium kribbense]|uniref:FtsK domain-containing protein n=1 Tax=Microbacterium kribbense TaxID=433645 RepID=A0ABP7GB35_9MICO
MPLAASAVPIVGGIALWLATGTMMMLWFAALGPLIAVASLADGARTARRDRRRAARVAQQARERVARTVAARHAAERERLWTAHPDVLRALRGDAHGADDIWRAVPGRGDELTVGRGLARSAVRVEGGAGDAAAAALRHSAALLDDAPVTVPADTGIAVVGPAPLARAVVRALVLQACLTLPPGRLHLSEPAGQEPDGDWMALLPHAQRSVAAGRTLGVCAPGDVALSVDILIARVEAGAVPPPACRAVLTLTGPDRAQLRADGLGTDVRVEGVSVEQAREIATGLAARAEAAFGSAARDEPVALADLLSDGPKDGAGLNAVIGTEQARPFRLDLVADGPHAVVAGITGSGKSELLTSWVTSLCARYDTDRVSFLLADFKGGTAFDALAALPHVTGVITDLDAGGSRRALQSLRAELRRREAEIVRAGARDIGETTLPRLVVVVDEFAALTAAHPELQELFTDIAARGRALGMHLILGTQRAAGTFRESLLANCPLRISLRVSDPADSRAVIGTDAAAALSGAPGQRGMALIRRAADAVAHPVRVALSSARLVAEVAAAAQGAAPRRPWLPALPERLTLAEASAQARPPAAGVASTEPPASAEASARMSEPASARMSTRASARASSVGIVLGIADEPDRQRQVAVTLTGSDRGLCVLGMAGSGRTALLHTVAAQAQRPVWIGPDPETAWDQLGRLADQRVPPGTVVLVDDADALLARFPLDYAQAALEHLERIVHTAGPESGAVVVSAQRAGGAVGRLLDLLPRRALLAAATRADFVAAGGAADAYAERMPPGRGVLDGRLVQFALPPAVHSHPAVPVPAWSPQAPVTGAVVRHGPADRRLRTLVEEAGARLLSVEQAPPLSDTRAAASGADPVVIVGDGDDWQREWRMLRTIAGEHDLLVDAGCAADYRVLLGERGLPPYCAPGRGRAWLIRSGVAPTRVTLAEPAAGPRET